MNLRRILPAVPPVLALIAAGMVSSTAPPASAQSAGNAPHVIMVAARPAIDVVFTIDATGSMGDEIEAVKAHLWTIASRIANGQPRPDVRFGIVVYRDVGDREHTRMVPLTRDLDAVHRELMSIQASGGGDTPEDVDAGLGLAVREMNWSAQASKMIFLIGDAEPHDYGADRAGLLQIAAAQQIQINTIEASGMSAVGEDVWRAIAMRTNGVADVLTYSQNVRMADGRERTIMRSGSHTFVAPRPLSAAERSEGASALVARGLAREASDDEVARSMGGSGRAGAPAAAAMDSDVSDVITRRVRERASASGVAYH